MTDIKTGKGFGYKDEGGKICMQRCFECGRENWVVAVSSGQCAFCGHDANEGKEDEY